MSAETVIVTGAGRGIGRAVALTLGADGMFVLCISKSESCEATRDEIRSRGGRADALRIDLGDLAESEKRVRAWADGTEHRRFGVVLAAAQLGPKGPLADTSLSGWDETFQVNLLGNLAVVRSVLDHMLEARFGRVLFFGGGGAAYAYPVFPAYAASKTAIVRVVENLALDLADAGDFAVVCLAPGAVETDLLSEVRRAGGEVRTVTSASEAASFAGRFMTEDSQALTGRFVHVRDEWPRVLSGELSLDESTWKLRRVE